MNRYNALLPNQEYVSTYVPLPLDSMMKAGMMKQKQYDDTIADAYKMEDLMKTVNAIDKHKDFKKSLEGKYYPKIEEIADQIVKTGDLSKAQEIKRLARQWETDPLRQELENSYANYQAYQKDKIAKGDKYGEWYDNYLPFKGSDESGNISGYRYTGMGEVQDHQKLALDMMDNVKEDGSKYDDAVLGADGIIRSAKGGSEHILSSKIRALAQGKATSFLATREGRDFAQMLSYYNPDMDLTKAAEEYLYQAGANQIFSKSERGNDIDVTSMWGKKYDEEAANRTTSSQSEAISNPAVEDITAGMTFDDKGNLIPITHNEYTMTAAKPYGSSVPGIGTGATLNPTGKKGLDAEANMNQNLIVVKLQKEHPELAGLKPKQVVEAYRKALKSVSSESIELHSVSNVAAKNIGEEISRNKYQRRYTINDGKGSTIKDTSLEAVLDELGVDAETFDKSLKSGIGGYTQQGNSAGEYYVEIPVEGNKTRRVTISPDKEMSEIFETSNEVHKLRKSLTQGITPDKVIDLPNGMQVKHSVKVEPFINKDGTANWKYTEVVKDMNDNIITTQETELSDIESAERDKLKSSNYLGSKLGILKDNTTY